MASQFALAILSRSVESNLLIVTSNFSMVMNRLVIVLLASLHLAMGWEYCPDCDSEKDLFGVEKFEVFPKSLHSVAFKVKAVTEVGIKPGVDDQTPKIELKIYEKDSNNVIYSDTKEFCDYAPCPVDKDEKVKLKIRVDDLDEKIKRDVHYVGEMSITKRCGTQITCVKDMFCVGKKDKGLRGEKAGKPEKTKDKNKKDKKNKDKSPGDANADLNPPDVIVFGDESKKKKKH